VKPVPAQACARENGCEYLWFISSNFYSKTRSFLHIFEYFQTFHIIFQTFSNVFTRFSLAYFTQTTQLNLPTFVFTLKTNKNPEKITPQNPNFPQIWIISILNFESA